MIPPITHPLGKYWKQPDSSSVIINDEYALVTEQVFENLPEYSQTIPTGAYEGKMWKAEYQPCLYGKFTRTGKWFLRWFGYSDKPEMVSNNQRKILIIDFHWEFELEL